MLLLTLALLEELVLSTAEAGSKACVIVNLGSCVTAGLVKEVKETEHGK